MPEQSGKERKRKTRLVEIGGYLVKVNHEDRFLKVYRTDEAFDLFEKVGRSAFRCFIYMCTWYMEYERNTVFISPSRKKELMYKLDVKSIQLCNLLAELEREGLLERIGHGEYYANGYCVGFGKISIIKTDKNVENNL